MNATIYQKFTEELTTHGFSHETILGYVKQIQHLVERYQRLPEEITNDELRTYLLELAFKKKMGRKNLIGVNSAFRAFHRYVLRRPEKEVRYRVPCLQTVGTIPQVYAPDEIRRILIVEGLRPRHRAILSTMYATGFHAEEISHLKVTDISSQQMRIHVPESKRHKARHVVVSTALLHELREHWRRFRPPLWMFPSLEDPFKPLDKDCVYRIFNRAIALAGLRNCNGVHSLRHSFAVHLLKHGLTLSVLQSLLGHRWPMSTAIYLNVPCPWQYPSENPLDLLPIEQIAKENGAPL